MIIIALLILICMITIILRFILQKSTNRKMLLFLIIAWIVSLLILGVIAYISAADAYYTDNKVLTGYWVNRISGIIVSSEYAYLGGSGFHPVAAFFIIILSFAAVSSFLGFSISTFTVKGKPVKSKIIVAIVIFLIIIGIVMNIERFGRLL